VELTILVFLPAVAAAVILLLPQSMEHNAKWVALAASLAILALSVQMFFAFDLNAEGYQYVERHEWVDIGQFNLQYFLGVDGLSMPLVVLTTVLTVASVLVSFSITMRPRAYYACLMVLASSVIGSDRVRRHADAARVGVRLPLHWLRGQTPDRTAAYVASRRSQRRADGGVGDAGRCPAEDGRLRHHPHVCDHVARHG
jgi:hypothetical protein